MSCPQRHIRPPDQTARETSITQVLLAEDGAVINLTLEDALGDGGYAVAGPFASGSTALAWLRDHTPDPAIMDLVPGDGPCLELARALRQRNVPMPFLGGYDYHSLPADLQGADWIDKPVPYDRLLSALASLQAPPA
jgi:DNA-binding response OmpR family regulator